LGGGVNPGGGEGGGSSIFARQKKGTLNSGLSNYRGEGKQYKGGRKYGNKEKVRRTSSTSSIQGTDKSPVVIPKEKEERAAHFHEKEKKRRMAMERRRIVRNTPEKEKKGFVGPLPRGTKGRRERILENLFRKEKGESPRRLGGNGEEIHRLHRAWGAKGRKSKTEVIFGGGRKKGGPRYSGKEGQSAAHRLVRVKEKGIMAKKVKGGE